MSILLSTSIPFYFSKAGEWGGLQHEFHACLKTWTQTILQGNNYAHSENIMIAFNTDYLLKIVHQSQI